MWDTEHATDWFLRSVRSSIHRVPYLNDLAQLWIRRGKPISTTYDLIKCYYSSLNVIQVPREGRTNLMVQQLHRIREQISLCCQLSYTSRLQARMLSKSEELGMFMQAAFDHFSCTLRKPFNFVEVSMKINPIPKDIGGNLLQLAIAVQRRDMTQESQQIFYQLSWVAASCVLLDHVRYRKGKHLSYHYPCPGLTSEVRSSERSLAKLLKVL